MGEELKVPEMKALIVEDSRIYQQLMQAVFDDLNVTAKFEETGQGCLDAILQDDYQLIFLDLHLPDIDGIEICRRLREMEQYHYLPIILLTEEDDEALLKQAFNIGITEVLRKSSFEELHESICHFVEGLSYRVSGRVLYIEDSPTTAQLTLHTLNSMGLEFRHFVSAELAFEAFGQEDFDVIITDIVVEGAMSGIGLVRAVRAMRNDKGKIPILAVSGIDDAARRVEILRHGANDFVSKPIIEEEFHARVSNLITSKQLFDQVREQQQQLHELATTDQLTKLYNRHYLNDAAAQAISNAVRHKQPLSLFVIDLDHFKKINDEYGHDRGDDVLSDVGGLLKSLSRDGDIAARFGGEEFVLVLTHCAIEDAQKKAEIFRLELENIEPGGLRVTASIGVASLDITQENTMDLKALFKEADKAVYIAKEKGRNRVVLAGDVV